jgi:hypothetical protein
MNGLDLRRKSRILDLVVMIVLEIQNEMIITVWNGL